MRLTTDGTNLLEHRAKMSPPDDLLALRAASGASAVWYFRHRPLPDPFREFIAAELAEPAPAEDFQRLSAVLHPVGQILLFDAEDGATPQWVLVACVRKPQRIFQDFLRSLLQVLQQDEVESLSIEFDSHRVLIASDPDRLAEVRKLATQFGAVPRGTPDPQASILEPDGPYLRYEGPWHLLPVRIRAQLEPLLASWPARAEDSDWHVRIEWLRDAGTPQAVVTIPANALRAEIEGLAPLGGEPDAAPRILRWETAP